MKTSLNLLPRNTGSRVTFVLSQSPVEFGLQFLRHGEGGLGLWRVFDAVPERHRQLNPFGGRQLQEVIKFGIGHGLKSAHQKGILQAQATLRVNRQLVISRSREVMTCRTTLQGPAGSTPRKVGLVSPLSGFAGEGDRG
jgi:hypothetical protein